MLSVKTLKGVWPALATPFSRDGSQLDVPSFTRLVEHVIGGGVQGVVLCGSTGEASNLSEKEYREVISRGVEAVAGRVPCIAGIGTNSTRTAVELARALEGFPLDGLMVVAPPYNKPPQRGIIDHFRAIKAATSRPLIAYNVPGRTGVNIQPATIAQLAQEGVIIGLKEASGSVDQLLDVLALVGETISVLSGEDSLVQASIAAGARGVISVAANVAPRHFSEMVAVALGNDMMTSRAQQSTLLPLCRAVFMETNPIPVKAALALLGVFANDTMRLPLVSCESSTRERLASILRELELLPRRGA